MLCVIGDTPEADRSGELGLSWIANVILTHFTGAPTRDVKETVIQRQINVTHQGRHGTKPLQKRGQLLLGCRLGWDRCCLLDVEFRALSPPSPDRGLEVGRIDDNADESIFPYGIMSRANLERHLMVGAEIDSLHMASSPQIPEMDAVTIFVGKQVLRNETVLKLWRQRPLTRDHIVARQVPPKVIMQLLGTAIDLPAPENVEGLAIHDEDTGRTVRAVLAAATQRTDINALRPAMNRVWPRVPGFLENFFRLNDFVDLSLGRIGLCVDDVDTRGAYAWND